MAHGVTCVACVLAALPWGAQSLLLLAVFASLASVFRNEKQATPAERLRLNRQGDVEVIDARGRSERYAVQPSTTIFRWLVVLRLAHPEGKLTLVLPPDSIAGGRHRHLRRWLLWQAKVDAA